MMEKFRRFMVGRYGADRLNMVLLGTGLVFSLLAMLFTRKLYIVADIFYLLVLLRALSRNHSARQKEDRAFWRFIQPIQAWWRRLRSRFAQRKTYKYFRCPHCKQQLRAPRGRGKIEVTCQRCRQTFRTKT